MRKIKNYFLAPRFTFNRIQFNFIALFFISIGLIAGTYFSVSTVVKHVFAATSPWTQTDWSGGSASGTVTDAVTTYSAVSNIDTTTTSGQFNISETSGWDSDLSSWSRRKAITITNSGSAQTNYQVKLSITYDSDMQSDFDDLRFSTTDGTNVDYWIQTKTDSNSATIWVEIPALAGSGDTTVYMYYGNSGASAASSGNNTFLLFDNFSSGSSLDTGKWSATSVGSLYSISSEQLSVGPGSSNWNQAIYSASAISRADVTLEATYKWTSSNSSYDSLMFGWKDDGSGSSYTNLVHGYYNSGNGSCTSGCAVNVYEDGSSRGGISGSWTVNTQYLIRVRLRSSGGAYYEQSTDDGSNWTTSYTSSYSTESNLHPAWTLHSGTHVFDDVRVRKWMSSEPSSSAGSEENRFTSSATLTSNIFDSGTASDWGTLTYSTSGSGTVTVKVRSDDSDDMSGATDWSSCSSISSDTDLTSTDCVDDTDQYIQYQVSLAPSGASSPVFQDISIAFTSSDQTAPTTNASSIAMATASSGGRSISSNGWNNVSGPYFSWTAGADNDGGSGLKGYCLYLGTDSSGNPATAKGVLGTSPVSTSGSTCQFIVSSASVNLSTSGYIGTSLSSGSTYYLNVKAIDNGNNVFGGSSAQFQFRQDSTAPTNVAYISAASGSFGNVADMTFNWPSSGGSAASDSDAGILGYQYQLNSSSGTWKGTETSSGCDLDYIPADTSSYTFTDEQDGNDVDTGTTVIYFRTVDSSCNTSSAATYRTASIAYGGAAPSFDTTCDSASGITVSPSTSTSNSFSLSWDDASPSVGRTLEKYYYMINTSPPSSYSTITSNTSTYISNGTDTSVNAGTLTGSVRGSNTVYVVAIDDADNYSSSNCIKGTYTLNSTNPDPPLNLAATDASVKASSLWRASLGWDVPSYKGTGTLTYKIQRSTDNSTWTDVTTTTGTSYIDTVAESREYYWRVGSYDTSSASQSDPSYATSVSLTPKGTYTDAPTLSSGPTANSITTKKAKISWSTSRDSDSKIQYGTKSGDYFTEEPSNSTQTTDHTINLTNLSPGITYYYKAKWTDEDGNTGTSDEKTFETDPAPVITDPKASSIGLSSAILTFTSKGATKVKIYYGKSSTFGGSKEVATSTLEATYTTELTGLSDGTKYFYKINTFDSEEVEYEGSILTFETLPRPRISSVRVQQVSNTAQSTLLLTWTSNTEISSIVTYFPESDSGAAHDEVNVALVKGAHRMIIRGLLPQTNYSLIVKGRDKAGNEASSDIQRVTTAIDTRPPQVVDLKIEGANTPISTSTSQDQLAQLVVTWTTDEPSTSQVEFGEGTGTSYSQKTQEDSNLTTNHLVIISGLTPSKVYHMRAISKDKAANEGKSVDTVSITPKATENALNLVIQNLQEVFGFLGKLE